MEDSNVNWQIGTFYRLLRLIALFFSVFLTAIYVACITFHYEVIPQTLLITLSESRARVPFPPIIEALLLEFFWNYYEKQEQDCLPKWGKQWVLSEVS